MTPQEGKMDTPQSSTLAVRSSPRKQAELGDSETRLARARQAKDETQVHVRVVCQYTVVCIF